VVTNLNDHGDGSLRQAIAEVSSNGVITFAAGLAGTIVLTSGEIDAFHTGFALQGPGARTLTVSGNNSGRVFSLYDGTFNLSGLTLANGVNTGQNTGRGGNLVISYPTEVNLQQCRITGGKSLEGAGIWNAGTLALTGCTLDNNFATNYGGGIFTHNLGRLIMTNCTVASNSAAYDGGVYSEGQADAVNCTIAFNHASVNNGGVVCGGGSFTLAGSLVASNTALSAPDVSGPLYSDGYNLIGNTNGGLAFWALNDQLNVPALIGPLGNYGGPTPTIALQSGSPAIDQGHHFGLTTDQRGFPRTLDDKSVANSDGGTDIGAFELDPNFRIVELRRVGSDIALSLMTVLGRNYRAEYTNNLASGNWTSFTTNTPGNGYLLWVTNSGAANQLQRFYRGVRSP
jgi:fibronectin-binding autotransporter adhesin